MGAFINGVYHEHADPLSPMEAWYDDVRNRPRVAAAHARLDRAANPFLGYTRPENERAIERHDAALARHEAVHRSYSTVLDKPGDPVGIQS